MPGWRMGWILIHDRNDVFAQEVRQGLMDLSQRILGPNTVVQGAVERILKETPQDYYDSIIKTVKVSTTFQFLMKTSRLNNLRIYDALRNLMMCLFSGQCRCLLSDTFQNKRLEACHASRGHVHDGETGAMSRNKVILKVMPWSMK